MEKPRILKPRAAPKLSTVTRPMKSAENKMTVAASNKSNVVNVTEKKTVESPTVESSPNGHYELNQTMSRILQSELQDVMIKVWQELPDNPPNDAEKMVADKFRNEVGDEICNALGLNVTKRLLNIHNSLFIKIHFSKMPETNLFRAFLLKYGVSAYKRISNNSYTFAAQLRTIQDFDRICSAKDIRCGTKVTITPCYKFTQCPVKLKTNFIINKNKTRKLENNDTAPDVTEKIISKTDSNKNNTENPIIESNVETKDVSNKQTEEAKPKSEVSLKPTTNKGTEVIKTVNLNKSEPSVKINAPKTDVKKPENKPNVNVEIKAEVNVSKVDPKPKINDKVTEIKSKPDIKTTPAKPKELSATEKSKVDVNPNAAGKPKETLTTEKANTSNTAAKPKESLTADKPKLEVKQNTVKAKEGVATKVTGTNTPRQGPIKNEINKLKETKTQADTKITQKVNNIINTKTTKQVQTKTAAVTKTPLKVNNTKTKNVLHTKNTSKDTIKAAPKSKSVKKYERIDDEEMNDEEILQLLSGGIVLDECGSEE